MIAAGRFTSPVVLSSESERRPAPALTLVLFQDGSYRANPVAHYEVRSCLNRLILQPLC
jgi:hypothetical protein